jgi:CheY-like chemotaxis protein
MSEHEICVVLENDTGTLEDISSSMGLIQCTVVSASSVSEAVAQVEKHMPGFVLARVQTNLEPLAGVLLAQELASNPDLAHIPVIALYYAKEETQFAEELERFVNRFEIPVRFPDFTRQVKEYLDSLDLDEGQKFQAATAEAGGNSGLKQRGGSGQPGSVALKRRIIIAYAIQLEVLRQLEANEDFQRASSEEIPGIVGRVTAGVCADFRIGEIVG